jgi:hypothetical protein
MQEGKKAKDQILEEKTIRKEKRPFKESLTWDES